MIANILVQGDSIFRGVVYDLEKRKYIFSPNRIEKQLQTKLNAKIINKSKFGNTTTRTAEKLQANLDKYAPELVILELGGNDCDFDWVKVSQAPKEDHKSNTDYIKYKEEMVAMIHQIRAEDKIPVLATIPPLDAECYFKWLCKLNNLPESSILEFIGNVSRIYWWQERYNAAILSIAHQEKCNLLDIRSAFLQTPDYRDYICIDGIHPNEAGQTLMSDYILSYIEETASHLLV